MKKGFVKIQIVLFTKLFISNFMKETKIIIRNYCWEQWLKAIRNSEDKKLRDFWFTEFLKTFN